MKTEILRKSALFRGIALSELERALACLDVKEKEYQKGDTIYHRGDTVHRIGLVLSGSVHIVKGDVWGTENILAHISPGQVFAETYACIGREPLMVDVIASEKAAVLFIDARKILTGSVTIQNGRDKLVQNLIQIMAGKNLYLSHKMSHITPKTIRERVLSYLSYEAMAQKNREFDIPFNRQQMADYLQVERSALSNELSKMREEGLLSFHKNHFILGIEQEIFP